MNRLGIVVGLLAGAVVASCYNPKIDEGAFLCGPGGVCPSGQTCASNGRCYKDTSGVVGGAGGTSGVTSDGPPVSGDAGGCQLACSPATSPTGACDPVCQSGCACGSQKCTNISGMGNVCQVTTAAPTPAYASCDPQFDACLAGYACLGEFEDVCGAHCYRFCRIDSDCGGTSRCTGEADDNGVFAYKVCGPPIEACDPTGLLPHCTTGQTADRTFPNFACYVLANDHPDEAVCECAGSVAEGQPCTREYECKPGNQCVPNGGESRCRRLCTLDSGPVANRVQCASGKCVSLGGSKKIGVCL